MCWLQLTDTPVTFTAYCFSGTSVVITFDFGDGSVPVTVAQPLLAAWSPGLVELQSHFYAYGGLYVASVTIANGFHLFQFNHSLIVYGKIGNITLTTNSPVALIGGRAVASLSFASPMPPANVLVRFNYGDGMCRLQRERTFQQVEYNKSHHSLNLLVYCIVEYALKL